MNLISNYSSSFLVSYGYSYIFKSFLPRIKNGYLCVKIVDSNYPDYQTPLEFGDKNSQPHTTLTVNNLYRFLIKVLFSGDIGFAESFILNDFEVSNLTALIKIFILNRKEMDDLDTKWAFVKHGVDRFVHFLHRNTEEGSKENIRAHYDLSNDMFQLFLDPTMSYSSAYFKHPEESLENAQINKVRMLINKANLKPDEHLLEIGSGWGFLAMEAVRMTGCRVTTISLSMQQVILAREKIEKAGLSDRIQVVYIDYRKLEGKFDKIISCEMLEAVGVENYPVYFESLEKLLKPDGLAVVQFISFNDQNFERYSKSCDFIQKYIFPGGLCPSITSIINAATNHSQLMLEHMENFGPHYATTLKRWRDTFLNSEDKILALGFDKQFIRTFDYYFSYCEAGFETRTINLLQMVFSRPCNTKNLPFYLNSYHNQSLNIEQ